MHHRSCSLAFGFYTKLYTKSAVSESSITLGRLNLTFFTAWTIFMKLGTLVHHVPGYKTLTQIFLILPGDLVMVFQSRKNAVKSSRNFERSYLVARHKLKNLRQHFVDLPFFLHSAKTISVYRNCFCLSQKKLNSTERGALFRHFCVSKVITTANAHKSGVIFHIFPRAFKQTKKIKALRPNMTKIASRGSCLNPLSATWRIYPSSKWSSQWPYDGYIRHGWMTSCGRGRDSATLECFGRGYRGTILVRSSKLSLFFPELCPFRRVFLFPALLKDLAPNVQAPGLLVSTMLWGSFWKLRSVTQHFFANSDYDHKYFLKISFLFSKQSRFYLPDSYGDPKSEQSTLVMVRRKLEWKLDFRALARSSAEGPSIVVAARRYESCAMIHCPEEKKTQGNQRVIVRRLNPSSSTKPASFEEPVSETRRRYRFALRCFRGRECTAAGRSDCSAGTAKKGSHPWHFRCWSLRRNELECTDLVHWTGALHVFRHVMQLSLLVLCWKSILTVILPQIKKKRSLSNVGHRGTKAENLAWHSTG